MKRKALLLLGVGLALLMVVAGMASAANPYLHYFDCKNCHSPNATMASMSADHVCLKCHAGASVTAPNDKLIAPLASALDPTGAADGKPGMINWKASSVFSTGDASNKYGHNPAPGKQTSHNWAASNVQPAAGAGEPTRTAYAGFYSRYGASLGKVTCSRCHNPHGEAVIDANADYNPVTRTGIDNPLGNPKLLIADSQNLNKPIDPEKMCRACHATYAAQVAGNHGLVGHAVNSLAGADNYASYISGQGTKYNATPLVPAAPYNQSYPTLVNGKMTCLSCHNLHYVDSNSTTADGLAGAASLQTGDGNLLRGDGEQFVKDPARGMSFCNTCHTYTSAFHGTGANAVGCLACHGGHNNTSATPSYYMLNGNFTTLPTTAAERAQVWGGTQAGVLDGFCESCHGNVEQNFPTLTTSLYTHSAGMTACDTCHQSHGAGAFSKPIGCDVCHGSPPAQATAGNPAAPDYVAANKDGYAWVSAANNYKTGSTHYKDETLTPHVTHSGTTSAYKYDCKVCHNTHYNNFATTHNQGITSYRDVLEAGATNPYDVKASGNSAMVPAYTDAAGTCSNVYCHSNGGVNNGTGTRAGYNPATPGWAGTRNTITCASCHGNDATTMGATGKVNSAAHGKHISAGFSCNFCHVDTATNATTLKAGAAGTKHINVAVEVVFDTTSVLKTGGAAMANGATPWGGATSTVCSAVYCHSNGNMNAGETVYRSINWTSATALTCTSCHNVPGLVGDKQTAAHAAHVNGSTSNVGRNLDCAVCHDNTMDLGNNAAVPASGLATHVNGKVDVKMNFSGVDLGTCSNISCHSDGNFEVGATTTYKNAVWTGATTYGCASCHGNGTVSYPTYANGGTGVNSNSHVKHIVGGGYTCNECHSQTSTAGTALDGTDKTKHVNRTVEVSGAKITSYTDGSETCAASACHGAGSPVWGGTISSCRACHSSATTDVDSFTLNGTVGTIALDEWTYSGHGKLASATYDVSGRAGADLDTKAGAGQDACLYCHDGNVSHGNANYFRLRSNGYLYNAAADLNGACRACHQTGTTSFDPDGVGGLNAVNVTSVVKIDKFHGGASHNGTDRDAGRWCWDCHDPHGDADVVGQRIQMVQRNPQLNPDANGVPASLSTVADIVFTNNTTGAAAGSFAMTAAPFSQGICNACHTALNTTQYTQTTGAGTHPTGKCTVCHKHSGDTTYDNLAFKGSGCNGCHGNSVAGNYWPDDNAGAAMPTANNAGKHAKHMEALSAKVYNETLAVLLTNNANGTSDAKQRNLCAFCHNTPGADGDHGILANLPADTNSFYAIWDTTRLTADNGSYSSPNATPVAGNDSCTNVNCHNNKPTTVGTYGWYNTPAASACIMCHSDAPAEQTHAAHLSGTIYGLTADNCAYCHDAATNWTTNTKPAANHLNGTFNVSGSVALTYDGTYPTIKGSCGANACHNNGRNGAPVSGVYTWGLTTNASCSFCHSPASGHTPHFAAGGVYFSGGAACNWCHTHSGPSADHLNATINVSATMGYTGTNLGVTQLPAYGACSTTTCHQSGKGAAVASPAWNVAWTGQACDLCHFNGSAAKAASGAHGTHIGTAGQNSYTATANASTAAAYVFNCGKCHGGTLANHLNSWGTWATPNVEVAAAVTYNAVADSCVNNACHNNGKGTGVGNDALRTAYWAANNWGLGDDSDKCNNCHGNSPTSNAHRAHAVGLHAEDIYSGTTGKLTTASATKSHGDATNSSTISCNVCHSGTVTTARNKFGTECNSCHNIDAAALEIAVADKSKHVDDGTAAAEVSFVNMTTFKSKAQLRDNLVDANDGTTILSNVWNRITGYKAATSHDTAQVAYAAPTFAAGNCSNVACHNNQLAIWNSAGNINPATYAPNCMGCHTSLPK